MKLQIKLLETDSLNENNNYYLYEVETDSEHYYIARSDEDINKNAGYIDLTNGYSSCALMLKNLLTGRDLEIAKYLFLFLWDSGNGTNTCAEQDVYEYDGFTREEMENFVDKYGFGKLGLGVLDFYEEGGVEIFWDYFSCFDMNWFNPWGD